MDILMSYTYLNVFAGLHVEVYTFKCVYDMNIFTNTFMNIHKCVYEYIHVIYVF